MEKRKIDFRLEAKTEDGKAIVYLHGDIVDERPTDWWTGEEKKGDFIIEKEVRNLFDGIKEDEIDIHINSYGGSVFASVGIFNFIRALNKKITCYVDGVAASGASLIAMAGDKLIMPANTMLMIHRASSFAWGNCKDLREVADVLEKLDNSTVLETYKAKFKGTDEELMALIDNETWISAREALENGLCDEVIELKKEEPEVTEKEIKNAARMMTAFASLKFS